MPIMKKCNAVPRYINTSQLKANFCTKKSYTRYFPWSNSRFLQPGPAVYITGIVLAKGIYCCVCTAASLSRSPVYIPPVLPDPHSQEVPRTPSHSLLLLPVVLVILLIINVSIVKRHSLRLVLYRDIFSHIQERRSIIAKLATRHSPGQALYRDMFLLIQERRSINVRIVTRHSPRLAL